MFGFKTKQDLVNKTEPLAYGLRVKLGRKQSNNSNLNMRICCPARRIGEAMLVPWVNKEIMTEHLKQISAVTEKGRHAVIIMDGASWHTNDIAEQFSNV
ncbi:hypothetical protein V9N52_000759, partial [Vibrio navarrensis]